MNEIRKHLTSILNLLLCLVPQRLAECILAHELEVFRGSVHLRPLHISHNNENIVAAVVVHAPQEHQLGELPEDHISVPKITG